MIRASVVQEIRRLLAEGKLSHRKIAKVVGVSRGSVSLIARGKRRDFPPRAELAPVVPAGPPERCPSCGSLVYMPCRLCHLRAILARLQWAITYRSAGPPGPLALELKEEHQARYEEVRLGAKRPQSPVTQPEDAS
jgi:hypothetical protein